MRSSSLVALAVLGVFGFGCFTSSDDAQGCSTTDAPCSQTSPAEYRLVAHGSARLYVNGVKKGLRSVSVTELQEAGSSADPIVKLDALTVTADSCGAKVAVKTGRAGSVSLFFDDGSRQQVVVSEPDRIEVVPAFDNLVANVSVGDRRSEAAPPGTFEGGVIRLSSWQRLRVWLKYFAGTTQLEGHDAANFTSQGNVKLEGFASDGSRDLADLVSTGEDTGKEHVGFTNGNAKTELDVRTIGADGIASLRWFAQAEDNSGNPNSNGARTANLLLRALDAEGHIVHGTHVPISRGGVVLGHDDFVTYNYDTSRPGQKVTAQLGQLRSEVTIHPAENDGFAVTSSNDAFTGCSFGRTKATAFGAASMLFAVIAIVRRRARRT